MFSQPLIKLKTNYFHIISDSYIKNWLTHCKNWLKPAWLYFVIFYPAFFELIYASNFHRRGIICRLAWCFVLTPCFIKLNKKYAAVLFILLMAMGSIEIGHLIIFKQQISSGIIFTLIETNFAESIGFFDLYFSFYHFFIIFFYCLIGIIIFINSNNLEFFSKKRIYTTGVFFVFICYAVYAGYPWSIPTVAEGFFNYFTELVAYKKISSDRSNVNQFNHFTASSQIKEPQLHVIVVGESTTRNHMSLYGYQKKTSPLLSQHKDLVVFKDVISAQASTNGSLNLVLTNASIDNEITFSNSISLISVLQQAGFYVAWLSSQESVGRWINHVNAIISIADNVTSARLKNNGMGAIDRTLLSYYDAFLAKPPKKEKIVLFLHLMGTHVPYRHQYPDEFITFPLVKPEDQQYVINNYDNAVRFNDFIVDSILNKLKSYSQNHPAVLTSLIYFSDHGEEVYDQSDFVGHAPVISRFTVEIPFLVWLSDAYQNKFPKRLAQLKNNENIAYMNDDFFHSFLDLIEVDTELKYNSKSLFSGEYIPNKRLVSGTTNYDIKLKSIKSKVLAPEYKLSTIDEDEKKSLSLTKLTHSQK